MAFFANLKIGYKILCALVAITLFVLIQGLIHIGNMNKIADEVEGMYRISQSVTLPVTDLKSQFRQLRIYAIRITASTDEILNNYQDKITKQLAETEKTISDALKAHTNPESASDFKTLQNDLEKYKASFHQIIGIIKDPSKTMEQKKAETTNITMTDMKQVGNDVDDVIVKMLTRENKRFSQTNEQIKEDAGPGLTIFMLLCSVALALAFTSLLSKSISGRIHKLMKASSQIAQGDLTVEVKAQSSDELGKLTDSINQMVDNLREIIKNMTANSKSITTSMDHMVNTNRIISESTSQILSQTLSVSAASEEMSATSKEIAANCNTAAQASEGTQATTQESIESVRNTVAKIREHSKKTEEDAKIIAKLGEETKQIDTIIATIQDIANQTNLLALNAAIEAARAGEHGRGFAVVSDEVRALANRTAQSTQEINKMIKTVQTEVDGAKISFGQTVSQMEEIAAETEEIENRLDSIINKVSDVNGKINQIAVATEQQTATSMNMSANLQQITSLTKDVSASAEDTLQSTQDMVSISEQINENTHKFKI